MEIKYKTKYHKTDTICKWKYSGVVYDDFEELYYIYMNTLNCSHCNKEFKNTKNRCLDHDHETGLFRAIICQKCNINDSYIKYPDGWDKKLWHKQYYESNKEKHNKKYDCECGGKYTYKHKKQHLKTIKHIAWFMEQVD